MQYRCWTRCAETCQLRQVVKRGRGHPRAYLLPSPVGKALDPEETFRPAVCPRSKVATPPCTLHSFKSGVICPTHDIAPQIADEPL